MKHVAKDSSARTGNWIDTFGSDVDEETSRARREREGEGGSQCAQRWRRVDEASVRLGGGGFASPMIALALAAQLEVGGAARGHGQPTPKRSWLALTLADWADGGVAGEGGEGQQEAR